MICHSLLGGSVIELHNANGGNVVRRVPPMLDEGHGHC